MPLKLVQPTLPLVDPGDFSNIPPSRTLSLLGMASADLAQLQARMFAYPDARRYRLGVNYQYLPTNAPKSELYCPIERDGRMNFTKNNGTDPNYIGTRLKPVRFLEKLGPNNANDKTQTIQANGTEKQKDSTQTMDHAQVTMPSPVFTVVTGRDFEQATAYWSMIEMQDGAQDRLINNAAAHIRGVTHKWMRDEAYGKYGVCPNIPNVEHFEILIWTFRDVRKGRCETG